VFWQVKIAKDDLQTRCERESASAAVDLAEKFGKELIPLIDTYYVKSKNLNYVFKRQSLKNSLLKKLHPFCQQINNLMRRV
jgi:hypothetical protein